MSDEIDKKEYKALALAWNLFGILPNQILKLDKKEKQALIERILMCATLKQGRHIVKPETIQAIEAILSKGDRVELIPVKDGIRVVRIRREPVK